MKALLRLIDAALFRRAPHAELTSEGFISAAVLAFSQRGWKVSDQEARNWVEDYIGAKIGSAGYEWTARSADLVVREYVSEFGDP